MTKTAAQAAEDRWENRRAMNQPGELLVPGRTDAVRCKVWDQSSSGAQVEIAQGGSSYSSSGQLSGTFSLFLVFDRAEVDCEVAWQNGNKLGVRFVSPMRVRPQRARRVVKPTPAAKPSLLGRLLSK